MRKLLLGIIAAGTLMAVTPAMAQVFIEGPGVGVRIGPDRHYHDHDRWDRRHYHSHAWRDRDCRTVTVRERRPDGRVVVRTRERC